MRISDWSSDVCSSDLERQAVELVEHAGKGRARIILNRDHRHKIARLRAGRRQFDRILAQPHPPRRDEMAQIAVRQRDRAHLALVEIREELARLRAPTLRCVLNLQHIRLVSAPPSHHPLHPPHTTRYAAPTTSPN